jgi:hypothetical protein
MSVKPFHQLSGFEHGRGLAARSISRSTRTAGQHRSHEAARAHDCSASADVRKRCVHALTIQEPRERSGVLQEALGLGRKRSADFSRYAITGSRSPLVTHPIQARSELAVFGIRMRLHPRKARPRFPPRFSVLFAISHWPRTCLPIVRFSGTVETNWV